jgi:hypothetical protein
LKPSAFILFLALVLALAVACGTDSPTPAINPQSAGEIEKAATELFDDWMKATEEHDAAAVHSLLSNNFADRCTAEQMEQFFEEQKTAFTYPEMSVKDVFVPVGDTQEAFITMELLGELKSGEEGIRNAYVAAMPLQIVKEDGRWHMLLQYPVMGEGCPFVDGYSREEATPEEVIPGGTATPYRP